MLFKILKKLLLVSPGLSFLGTILTLSGWLSFNFLPTEEELVVWWWILRARMLRMAWTQNYLTKLLISWFPFSPFLCILFLGHKHISNSVMLGLTFTKLVAFVIHIWQNFCFGPMQVYMVDIMAFDFVVSCEIYEFHIYISNVSTVLRAFILNAVNSTIEWKFHLNSEYCCFIKNYSSIWVKSPWRYT